MEKLREEPAEDLLERYQKLGIIQSYELKEDHVIIRGRGGTRYRLPYLQVRDFLEVASRDGKER